jgi:poly(A) polymerase Pap1
MTAMTSNLSQFAPVYQPISIKAPNDIEKFASSALKHYIDRAYPQESTESRRAREKVLAKVEKLIKNLVEKCTIATGVSEDQANEGGGNIFISGSYRLGVHTEGTDIDIICCLPRQVTKDNFFGDFLDELSARADVSEVTPITEAVVPMIGLKIDGIDIDLLYSCLPFAQVNLKEKDILDDNILRGVDDQTAKCLNGPRVTNMLYKLVPNFNEFAICLRCLRLWGKKRGIYSNKMGYLGGVNFAILSAFISQLYPKAPAATLLKNFFRLMLDWKWPNPIRLCPKYEPGLNMEQWDPTIDRRQLRDLMPILTPAYPIMNSTYSTNQRTMEVMMTEFQRGKDICEKTIKNIMLRKLKADKLKKNSTSTSSSSATNSLNGNDNQNNNLSFNEIADEFSELFEPFDFFSHFSTYLVINITANTEDELLKWEGFVESRVRQLVVRLGYLPFSAVRPHPKVLHDDGNNEKASGEHNVYSAAAFIGIETDPNRAKGTVDLVRPIQQFKDAPKVGVMNWSGRKDGMNVDVKVVKFKDLPSFVFSEENGGRQEAKKRHKVIRKYIKEANEKERLEKERQKQALIAATTWTRSTAAVKEDDNNGDEKNDEKINHNDANTFEDDSLLLVENNVPKGPEGEIGIAKDEIKGTGTKNETGDNDDSILLKNENVKTEIVGGSKLQNACDNTSSDNDVNNIKDDGQNKKCIAEKELLRAQNKEKDEQVKEEMKKTIDLNSMIKQSKKRKNHGKSKKRKKLRRDVGSLQEF